MRNTLASRISAVAWALVLLASATIALLVHLPWLGGGWIPKLQAFALWLLIVPLVAGLVALSRRRWIFGALLVCCLVVGVIPSLNPSVPVVSDPANGETLNVMSFNALKAGADRDELAQSITDADPDVLVLVETSEELHAALDERGVLGSLQYRTAPVPAGGARDTVIFSRYPLTERPEELSQAETGWYSLPVADINTPHGMLTVVGVHLFPPLHDATGWSQGLSALTRWAQSPSASPVILLGDFNSVRAHPGYRQVSAGFTEASGLAPDFSWPANKKIPALIEIDHILVRQLAVQHFETAEITGSDHRALFATLKLVP